MTVPPEAQSAILAWFDARGRSFPFRGIQDPYAILVSETMAQQTQIGRATQKWTTFLARFPTVEALAAASPAAVLREWRGLGYNRRALNLRLAARAIVEDHGAVVPADLAALERLPGVGPYTARAVAALAFGRAVGPVDTNVRRVLRRFVAGSATLAAPALQAIADGAVPVDRPGDWTHALMDLGATVCRPARPDCAACPVRAWCAFDRQASAGAPAGRPAGAVPAALRFRETSRWLRGRLLDRLRDAPGEDWVALEPRLGQHGPQAVERALAGMAREGLVERHPADPHRARLPVG